ncbi:MAG: type VI secretion system tube protein Hcp [Sphingomonadaceae bacterium]
MHLVGADGKELVAGWIPVSSFGMDFSAETSYGKGSGASVGKASASEVTLGLGISAAITKLLSNEVRGTSIATVEVEAYAPHGGVNGKPALVDEYFFNTAFVTGVDSNSSAENALSFGYRSFSHSHLAYNQLGKLDAASSSSVGYSIIESKLIGVPSPQPDVFG